MATIADATRLPMPTRWRAYREHGRIGAEMLKAAGATNLSIAFAAHHPGPVPDGIEPDAWLALERADDA